MLILTQANLSITKEINTQMKLMITLFALSFASISFAGAPASTPALLEKGKAAYTTNCLSCHGEKGDGKGPAGAYMKPAPRNFATDKFKAGDKVDAVFNTITKGLPNTAMVAFGYLSEEDRWGLSYYVLSFRKK